MPRSHQFYHIGGLVLRIEGEGSMPLLHRIPGMSLFATPPAPPDISIQLDQPIQVPSCRLLHHFQAVNATTPCRFGIDTTSSTPLYYYTLGSSAALQFNPLQPTIVRCTPIPNPQLLRFALWLAYSMLGLPLGRIPIHASAVVHHGQAVLCLGESGSGKSTHTRLWTQHIPDSSLLNDDSPILSIGPQAVHAYGSPWSGKTPCFLGTHFPVAALVRIQQQPVNTISRLLTIPAFAAVLPSCPPSLASDTALLDRTTECLSTLIASTPVYLLGCRPDPDAARLCHHTLFPSCS